MTRNDKAGCMRNGPRVTCGSPWSTRTDEELTEDIQDVVELRRGHLDETGRKCKIRSNAILPPVLFSSYRAATYGSSIHSHALGPRIAHLELIDGPVH
jgi:hypothetical protein